VATFDYIIINKKTLNILNLLKKPRGFNELWSEIKGSSITLKDYVDRLVNDGYVDEEWQSFPKKRILSLSDKGKKILKKMGELDALI